MRRVAREFLKILARASDHERAVLKRSNDSDDLRSALAAAQARIAALETERVIALRTDPLTGTSTEAAFRAASAAELDRARRSGAPLALVLYEVDDRRQLTAIHGPEAVEHALKTLTGLVRDDSRANDVVGRTGPGELAVLLPDTELAGALTAATRTVGTIDATDFPGIGPMTVSAGVARALPKVGIDTLLAEAAEHLARAQAAGGGRAHGPLEGDQPVARIHQDVIDALATALTERDQYTGDHSESVVQLSKAVASSFGMDAVAIERVSSAALLHDIGKVAIPDSILHKPAKLDEHEWALMREHPVIGERILKAIPGLGGVARIVRHEHERWDGGGYPDGLRGDDIPLGSRIILACDTYHAMTSDRPYRARMSHPEALEELARCAGTQFDPRVTEKLIGQLWSQQQAGVVG